MESIYFVLTWLCHRRCRHCYDDRFRPYARQDLENVVGQSRANVLRIIDNLPERMTYRTARRRQRRWPDHRLRRRGSARAGARKRSLSRPGEARSALSRLGRRTHCRPDDRRPADTRDPRRTPGPPCRHDLDLRFRFVPCGDQPRGTGGGPARQAPCHVRGCRRARGRPGVRGRPARRRNGAVQHLRRDRGQLDRQALASRARLEQRALARHPRRTISAMPWSGGLAFLERSRHGSEVSIEPSGDCLSMLRQDPPPPRQPSRRTPRRHSRTACAATPSTRPSIAANRSAWASNTAGRSSVFSRNRKRRHPRGGPIAISASAATGFTRRCLRRASKRPAGRARAVAGEATAPREDRDGAASATPRRGRAGRAGNRRTGTHGTRLPRTARAGRRNRFLARPGGGSGGATASPLWPPTAPKRPTAFLAVAAGATAAPLNPSLRTEEFRFQLEDLGARLLLAGPGCGDGVIEVARELGLGVAELQVADDAPAGRFALATIHRPRMAPTRRGGRTEGDDAALVLHTSGTTSRPKIVPLTQANLCASAAHVAASLALKPRDRCLNVMPLFHIHWSRGRGPVESGGRRERALRAGIQRPQGVRLVLRNRAQLVHGRTDHASGDPCPRAPQPRRRRGARPAPDPVLVLVAAGRGSWRISSGCSAARSSSPTA